MDTENTCALNMMQSNILSHQRLIYIDYLKAFAVLLVILGHILDKLFGHSNNIYCFIYLFHMPLFFMISGMTFDISSKHSKWDAAKLLRREINLVIPLLAFIFIDLIFLRPLTIINVYTGIWYLIHFILILLIFHFFQLISKKPLLWMNVCCMILWLLFSFLQLYLIDTNRTGFLQLIIRELGKLFGYALCFTWGIKCSHLTMRTIKKLIVTMPFVSVIFLVVTYLLNLQLQIALSKILCGMAISTFIISLCTYLKAYFKENPCVHYLAIYSLEIYLIHVNIVHAIMLPNDYVSESPKCKILMAAIFLLLDVVVPYVIIKLERLKVIDLIFHPARYMSKQVTINKS